MKKFNIAYTIFGNFGSHRFIYLENYNKELIKPIIYNMLLEKEKDFDWELTYNDLEINKVFEKINDEDDNKSRNWKSVNKLYEKTSLKKLLKQPITLGLKVTKYEN